MTCGKPHGARCVIKKVKDCKNVRNQSVVYFPSWPYGPPLRGKKKKNWLIWSFKCCPVVVWELCENHEEKSILGNCFCECPEHWYSGVYFQGTEGNKAKPTVVVFAGETLLCCDLLEHTDSPAQNFRVTSHFASSVLLHFFFLLTLTLSRTPMPFRLVSPVSNADMNLPGDKGPNYSRGLIVHRLTVSNCPPSVKPGTENV